jgi:hypothetical protein
LFQRQLLQNRSPQRQLFRRPLLQRPLHPFVSPRSLCPRWQGPLKSRPRAARLSHLRRLRAIGAAGRKSLLVVGSRARPGQTFSSGGAESQSQARANTPVWMRSSVSPTCVSQKPHLHAVHRTE